jgi:hypothetical protein
MTARLAGWVFPVVIFATLCLSSGATPGTPQQVKTAAPATMPERKSVTLQADKLLFSKALAELSKQTGIRVEDARGVPDATISLDWKQTPFWQALDALAAAGQARVTLYPTSGRIVLNKRGDNYRLPPISYDGRFRLSVKKVTASRDLEVRDGAPHGGATELAIEIAWDPELLPLYLETRPRGLRLVDDGNHNLTLPDEGSSLSPVDGGIALGIDLRLPALPRSVKSIRSLEGALSMIGPNKMLTFTFATLDRLDKTKSTDPERQSTQEGVTCRILDVQLLRERWTIRVALDYPPGMKQLDTNQSWVVNNEMTLETPDGKKRLPNTKEYALESATARHAVLQYHFRDREGAPRGKASDWRVRYRTPANLIEVPIKFAFKDIPLP